MNRARHLAALAAVPIAALIAVAVITNNGDDTPAPTATATASASPTGTPTPTGDTWTVTRVVDGDTFHARQNGHTITVRVIGIDTPETKDPRKPVQCYGPEASAYAHRELDDQTVTLTADPTQGDLDKYGRALRYVTLADGQLYEIAALEAGTAREYTYQRSHPYQRQADFRHAQLIAQQRRQGLWGACPA